MLRVASVILALAATALSQTGGQYSEMSRDNLASTIISSKPLLIGVGVRTWAKNTEMDHTLFTVSQSIPDVKFVRAESADVQPLLEALQLEQLPAYVFINPSCDKVIARIGLLDASELKTFVEAGKQPCGAFDNPFTRNKTSSRKELLSALGIPDKTQVGLGIEVSMDKPLGGIVVGAPDEGEKLARPVVISHEKPLTVVGVATGSPADKNGIHAGDRITAINGDTVNGASMSQIGERLHTSKSGDKVVLSITPKEGKGFTITVLAAEYLAVYKH